MSVIHIKSGAEYDKYLQGGEPLVVDFSATWCGPCKMIAPKFEAFSKENPSVKFLHIDVDDVQDHEHVKNVSGVPHFKFFKGGNLVLEFSGANVPKLQEGIKQLL